MKKLLALLVIVLLGSGIILAQTTINKEIIPKKMFLVFHGGPSFPINEFSQQKLNPNSFFGGGGFAKTGYNLNLEFGYQFYKNFGFMTSVFYNNNNLNSAGFVKELNQGYSESGFLINVTGIKLNHWRWYGITVGPAAMVKITNNVFMDLRMMGGIANANSPKVTYQGEKIFGEDWSTSSIFQAGADLRFGISGNLFIITNFDYTYMNPKFSKEYTDPISGEVLFESGKQKMKVLTLNAGVGLRF